MDETEGVDVEVPLKQASIRPAQAVNPDALTPEQIRWFRSPDNPLRDGPKIPDAILQNWTELSPVEKREIYRWYLANGWRIAVTVYAPGNIAVECANLLNAHYSRALAKNRRIFMDSLSGQQRELFDQIGKAAVSAVDDPNPKPMSGELERLKAEFEASLTPEQAAMRRRLTEPPSDEPSPGAEPRE